MEYFFPNTNFNTKKTALNKKYISKMLEKLLKLYLSKPRDGGATYLDDSSNLMNSKVQ